VLGLRMMVGHDNGAWVRVHESLLKLIMVVVVVEIRRLRWQYVLFELILVPRLSVRGLHI